MNFDELKAKYCEIESRGSGPLESFDLNLEDAGTVRPQDDPVRS